MFGLGPLTLVYVDFFSRRLCHLMHITILMGLIRPSLAYVRKAIFIDTLIRSFVHSFVCMLVRLFIQSFV